MTAKRVVTLIRKTTNRTDEANISADVKWILSKVLSGQAGRNWEPTIGRAATPYQEKGKWHYKRIVTFKRVGGHAAKEEKQWGQILVRLIKCGANSKFAKNKWFVEGPDGKILHLHAEGSVEARHDHPPLDEKDAALQKKYAEICLEREQHFSHIYDRGPQIERIISAIKAAKASEMENRFHCVLYGEPGCHAKGQGILLFDGTSKSVEQIVVGEKLMGIDGPRIVLRLVRGSGKMFTISPIKGNPFTVNEDHILTLARSKSPKGGNKSPLRKGSLLDVSVRDYLNWSGSRKSKYKLIRSNTIKFEICSDLPLPPYIMGAVLGDGNIAESLKITTNEYSHFENAAIGLWIDSVDLKTSIYPKTDTDNFDIAPVGVRGKSNPVVKVFRDLGLGEARSHDKFVPQMYKTASIGDRRRLLAGYIDTDGEQHGNVWCATSKSQQLINDMAFVARSLGLAAYMGKKYNKKYKRYYHTLNLSGDLDMIPVLNTWKVCSPRRQPKCVRHVGFTIAPVGDAEYFGFTVDGDNRYLLDDFTITHNCGKSEVLLATGAMLGTEQEHFLKLDATSTTKAGIEQVLLNPDNPIPPVIMIEEIEKTNENDLRWLLGVLDKRGEIRKLNFRVNARRSVPMLCLATVNNMNLFKTVLAGALASRFPNKLYFPRPGREIMQRILEREVLRANEIAKTNDKPAAARAEWIEPTLVFAVDQLGINDPREVTPICLCGGEDLLTGQYQKWYISTMEPQDQDRIKKNAPELFRR